MSGCTALHVSTREGHLDGVRALLECGADIGIDIYLRAVLI